MRTNLLTNIECFRWNDLTTDRSFDIDELDLALGKAIEDDIYSHPECYTLMIVDWGEFYHLLTLNEEELRVWTGGWLTPVHQITLLNLWNRSTTPQQAHSLDTLNSEYQGYNNGLIGFCLPSPMVWQVYNEESWVKFHQNYVRLNPGLRHSHPLYFRKFYIPLLTEPANQINSKIQRGHVHSFFERLDIPTYTDGENTLHGEQIHIHFREDNSALNIDGTWKHGRCVIPDDACQQLEEWGFLLPE